MRDRTPEVRAEVRAPGRNRMKWDAGVDIACDARVGYDLDDFATVGRNKACGFHPRSPCVYFHVSLARMAPNPKCELDEWRRVIDEAFLAFVDENTPEAFSGIAHRDVLVGRWSLERQVVETGAG